MNILKTQEEMKRLIDHSEKTQKKIDKIKLELRKPEYSDYDIIYDICRGGFKGRLVFKVASKFFIFLFFFFV